MLEIVEATSNDIEEWETFLERSNSGTLFHSLAFLSYHDPDRADWRHLLFRDSGRTLAVLPGALTERSGETVFTSPWGASFGGWALCGTETLEEVDALVEALLAWCRAREVRGIEISPPPAFYLDDPNQLVEFALLAKGFERFRWDATDVVPLGGGFENARARWQASARKGVRKAAESGVVVRESVDLDAFYPMLEENRKRHGAEPTHTLAELRRLFDRVGDRLKLLLGELDGVPVAGALLFRCNRQVVLNFYLCHRDEAKRARPADAVMARSVEAALEWGARYYDLGTSSLGGVPNPGLLRFKGKWGSRLFLREGYRAKVKRNTDEHGHTDEHGRTRTNTENQDGQGSD